MLPKIVFTDIDGVWTDGGMYYTEHGDVMKRFSVKDGWGVSLLRALHIPVVILTGENTPIVQKRAEKLKVDYCFLGVQDKEKKATDLCRQLGIALNETAFIGDDLNDLPLLCRCGFSGCVPNAPVYVKNKVQYITQISGGYGAFREFVEYLLQQEGLLDVAIAKLSC